MSDKEKNLEIQQKENDVIIESGQLALKNNDDNVKIHLLSIIGEVEGHDILPANSKTTKYEHVLPKLAQIEDDKEYKGVLLIINTVGGDVESGLAIAEMVASLSKPTVSLVLGGSHSIGIPLAVSTDYSFIVPSGTMVIHPVRMNGQFIGAPQTYEYFKLIQDRIVGFVTAHCKVKGEDFERMMLNKGIMTKDLGTILVGEEAVKEGIIDEIGGIDKAMRKLHELIEIQESERKK
ncbi:MAG: ATP-dependent Clp protease proteolytic subunit [Lachnospiraceae bacterium]|nr:ATP-dependent Clp protease proteolytic subunit [Clostridiales bacterium]MDD6293292.1 ATP-dependent Clp protease proteolytic subunit [Eubacteriales bacterium]MDY2607967.1 ATP-dependent Clp protease proteolytic subunit [Lachnospiraceae bacterium]